MVSVRAICLNLSCHGLFIETTQNGSDLFQMECVLNRALQLMVNSTCDVGKDDGKYGASISSVMYWVECSIFGGGGCCFRAAWCSRISRAPCIFFALALFSLSNQKYMLQMNLENRYDKGFYSKTMRNSHRTQNNTTHEMRFDLQLRRNVWAFHCFWETVQSIFITNKSFIWRETINYKN